MKGEDIPYLTHKVNGILLWQIWNIYTIKKAHPKVNLLLYKLYLPYTTLGALIRFRIIRELIGFHVRYIPVHRVYNGVCKVQILAEKTWFKLCVDT